MFSNAFFEGAIILITEKFSRKKYSGSYRSVQESYKSVRNLYKSVCDHIQKSYKGARLLKHKS